MLNKEDSYQPPAIEIDFKKTLKKLLNKQNPCVEEIRVIKIQKARKMKYNNAEGVTIMKLPKTEKNQNATTGVESHSY